ncbi:MAG: ABC transporter substrate-binding protein [Chloroflexota bacterium]
MTYRRISILVLLAFLLVSVFPLAAQETECEEGFRLFDHEQLSTDPVCIPENPQRIVTLDSQAFDLMLASGAIEPVGAVGFLESIYDRNFPYMVEGKEITYVGFPADLELILSLEPDLILGNALRELEIYDQLSAIAPTIVSDRLPNVFWEDNMRFLGEALNLTEEVDALLAEYDARVATLQELLGDPSAIEISVIRYRLRDAQANIDIQLANAFSTDILADVGFARPEIQALPVEEAEAQFGSPVAANISLEELQLIDGQYLFAWAQGASVELDAGNAEAWGILSDNPLWSTLEAVQNEQAFQVGGHWVGWGFAAAHEVLDDLFVHVAGVDPAEVSPNPFLTDEMEEMDEASVDTCETGFRLIEHVAGETCIPEDPQRIAVAGDRHITETLVAMGIEPIAIANKVEIPEFVQVEFNDFEAVIDLGTHFEPNLEVLLEVQPDLIIMHGDIYDTLSQIAPTVQINNPFNGVEAVVMDVGSIFGEDQTELLLALLDDAVETVTCAVENPEAITVSMIEHWQGSIGLNTTIPWNTSAFLIEEVGFSIPEAHVAEEIS